MRRPGKLSDGMVAFRMLKDFTINEMTAKYNQPKVLTPKK